MDTVSPPVDISKLAGSKRRELNPLAELIRVLAWMNVSLPALRVQLMGLSEVERCATTVEELAAIASEAGIIQNKIAKMRIRGDRAAGMLLAR